MQWIDLFSAENFIDWSLEAYRDSITTGWNIIGILYTSIQRPTFSFLPVPSGSSSYNNLPYMASNLFPWASRTTCHSKWIICIKIRYFKIQRKDIKYLLPRLQKWNFLDGWKCEYVIHLAFYFMRSSDIKSRSSHTNFSSPVKSYCWSFTFTSYMLDRLSPSLLSRSGAQ